MDDGQRRQIRFHSFRSFVKTTISNQGYQDFSEWLLGHRSSMSMKYYKIKEPARREIYQKCMKYLTFLDYPTVESVGADFESKLRERDQEIAIIKGDLDEMKSMYLKAMAGHVVMESDLKDGTYEARSKRKKTD